MKMGHCVNKATVAKVCQKVEMTKEICTNNCVVDISQGENPWEKASKTEVEG